MKNKYLSLKEVESVAEKILSSPIKLNEEYIDNIEGLIINISNDTLLSTKCDHVIIDACNKKDICFNNKSDIIIKIISVCIKEFLNEIGFKNELFSISTNFNNIDIGIPKSNYYITIHTSYFDNSYNLDNDYSNGVYDNFINDRFSEMEGYIYTIKDNTDIKNLLNLKELLQIYFYIFFKVLMSKISNFIDNHNIRVIYLIKEISVGPHLTKNIEFEKTFIKVEEIPLIDIEFDHIEDSSSVKVCNIRFKYSLNDIKNVINQSKKKTIAIVPKELCYHFSVIGNFGCTFAYIDKNLSYVNEENKYVIIPRIFTTSYENKTPDYNNKNKGE